MAKQSRNSKRLSGKIKYKQNYKASVIDKVIFGAVAVTFIGVLNFFLMAGITGWNTVHSSNQWRSPDKDKTQNPFKQNITSNSKSGEAVMVLPHRAPVPGQTATQLFTTTALPAPGLMPGVPALKAGEPVTASRMYASRTPFEMPPKQAIPYVESGAASESLTGGREREIEPPTTIRPGDNPKVKTKPQPEFK